MTKNTEKGAKAELAEGRDITFTVYKRAWDYVLVQDDSGYRRRWQETVSEVEGASKTVTVPQGADLSAYTAKVAFDLPSGCYDIVAEYGSDIRTTKHVSVCLESQKYPDSPNHDFFPSTVLRPGEKYEHTVIYKLSVK